MNPIQQSLTRLFERNRLVFWYDPSGGWKGELDALDLGGVTVLRIENDELNTKFRVLRDEPEGKFLLYFATEQPKDEENWLLDLLLANAEFHADRASLYREETGLPRSSRTSCSSTRPSFPARRGVRPSRRDSSPTIAIVRCAAG